MTMPVALRRRRRFARRQALLFQALLIAVLLSAWELVPRLPGVSAAVPVLDPFFISSPTRVLDMLASLAMGGAISGPIWPFARETVQNALIGTAAGMLVGAAVGLLLSNDERLNQVVRPFVVAGNAVPRIAIIPIIVILFGASAGTSLATATITGFFTVFFNAYEGGRSLPPQMVDNARVMGATPTQLMRDVRLRYVVAWSFATLPNAVSNGLLTVVTAEILTGYSGMGRLLMLAIGAASASLTVATVVVLSTIGLILVGASEILRARALHWWIEGRAA